VINTEKTLFRVGVVSARDPKWQIADIRRGTQSLLVFVLLPREYSRPAEYFVLTRSDFRAVIEPKEKMENDKRKNKQGWMPAWQLHDLQTDDLEPYRGDWDRIAVATGLPRRDWVNKSSESE
jgi:hypothetical protein